MAHDPVHSKAVVFDLDGVIYRGRTPIAGGSETVDWLRTTGRAAYYFTNNSTRTRESYVELLTGFGLRVSSEQIVTSASLTAHYLRDHFGPRRACVLVVGEAGLVSELRQAGLRVVRRSRPGIDAVVVGMDRRFTYRRLYEAQQALLSGAVFIATNRDATYPVEGSVIPGGGSIVAAVATAALREPITIGKPSRRSGLLITHQAGVRPAEAVLVGDRIETDIACARRAGLWGVLVETGISTRAEAATAPARVRPHWVIPSIAALPDLLLEVEEGSRPPFDWLPGEAP